MDGLKSWGAKISPQIIFLNLDISACGKGDKQYDYCWLLWSFEHNLKTKQYSDLLLKELNIEIDADDYLRYVALKMINESGNY